MSSKGRSWEPKIALPLTGLSPRAVRWCPLAPPPTPRPSVARLSTQGVGVVRHPWLTVCDHIVVALIGWVPKKSQAGVRSCGEHLAPSLSLSRAPAISVSVSAFCYLCWDYLWHAPIAIMTHTHAKRTHLPVLCIFGHSWPERVLTERSEVRVNTFCRGDRVRQWPIKEGCAL